MTTPDWQSLPPVDKHRLIGACTRLAIRVDAAQLAEEVRRLPAGLWGSRGGRGGVHDRADAIFLRGYAPADRGMPLVDRPPLEHLPIVRDFITTAIPAPPMRCVLARLGPKSNIPAHADSGPYFERTIRLHVPVRTNPSVVMYAGGLSYCMQPGEVWALNNSGTHGVLNDDPAEARIHLICDFLPSAGLLQLIAAGDPRLGTENEEVTRRFKAIHDSSEANDCTNT